MATCKYIITVSCDDPDVSHGDVAAMAGAYMDMLVDTAYLDSDATGVWVDVDVALYSEEDQNVGCS